MKFYSYFRSGAAYRARIALNLKGVDYQIVPVHLRKGAHLEAAYRKINPQARIPSLELDDGTLIAQSPAIIDYLEEAYPAPPFLPADPGLRAKIRAVAMTIACDVHPLNNLAVHNYLRGKLGQDDRAIEDWSAHWVREGFSAIEKLISAAPYAFGKNVTLADIYIVPQIATARRFNVPLDDFPKILSASQACEKLDAFIRAHPDNQPDTEI